MSGSDVKQLFKRVINGKAGWVAAVVAGSALGYDMTTDAIGVASDSGARAQQVETVIGDMDDLESEHEKDMESLQDRLQRLQSDVSVIKVQIGRLVARMEEQ